MLLALNISNGVGMNSDRLDSNVFHRPMVLAHWQPFQFVQSFQSVDNMPDNRVFPIQRRQLRVCDEKLRLVRIWTTICHRHYPSLRMPQFFKYLVLVFRFPDALSAFASVSAITGLYNEAFDVSVEHASVVVRACTKREEVFT